MSGQDFERFVLEAFRRHGYEARATTGGADGGVDLFLRKDGATTLVQCKQWRNTQAGVVAAERADHGFFVGSRTFTQRASAFAQRVKIRLIDGKELEGLIRPVQEEHSPFHSSPPVLNCPRCGQALVTPATRRGARTGESFLGCSAFPRCRYISDA